MPAGASVAHGVWSPALASPPAADTPLPPRRPALPPRPAAILARATGKDLATCQKQYLNRCVCAGQGQARNRAVGEVAAGGEGHKPPPADPLRCPPAPVHPHTPSPPAPSRPRSKRYFSSKEASPPKNRTPVRHSHLHPNTDTCSPAPPRPRSKRYFSVKEAYEEGLVDKLIPGYKLNRFRKMARDAGLEGGEVFGDAKPKFRFGGCSHGAAAGDGGAEGVGDAKLRRGGRPGGAGLLAGAALRCCWARATGAGAPRRAGGRARQAARSRPLHAPLPSPCTPATARAADQA